MSMPAMSSKLTIRSWVEVLKQTASEWSEDNALRLSAALAYYSIFSIAPLVIIAAAIAGWVLGEEAAQGLVSGHLRSLLGSQAAEGVEGMVQSASKPSSSAWAALLGAGALLFGASGVFGQLKDALNTIWEVRARSGGGAMRFIRERLLSFGMVLVIGFLLLVSLLLTTALSAVAKYVDGVLPFPEGLIGVIGSLISFAMVTALFAAIFKVLPDVRVHWRDVWIGAGATALLFEIGKVLLGLYLGREGAASAYGAAGSLVLVLLWVYYTSLILFFGAEFTQVHAQARGARIEPSENAEPLTEEMRAQQGLVRGRVAPDDPSTASGSRVPRKEVLAVALDLKPTGRRDEAPLPPANVFALLIGAVIGGFLLGLVPWKRSG
jgi:membrane protein